MHVRVGKRLGRLRPTTSGAWVLKIRFQGHLVGKSLFPRD